MKKIKKTCSVLKRTLDSDRVKKLISSPGSIKLLGYVSMLLPSASIFHM